MVSLVQILGGWWQTAIIWSIVTPLKCPGEGPICEEAHDWLVAWVGVMGLKKIVIVLCGWACVCVWSGGQGCGPTCLCLSHAPVLPLHLSCLCLCSIALFDSCGCVPELWLCDRVLAFSGSTHASHALSISKHGSNTHIQSPFLLVTPKPVHIYNPSCCFAFFVGHGLFGEFCSTLLE